MASGPAFHVGGRGGGRNIRSCFMQQAPVRVKHQPHALLVAKGDFVLPVTSLFAQWFRKKGWKDQDAVLQFPENLTKENRKLVHEIAQSFGLGTSSSGFGETV